MALKDIEKIEHSVELKEFHRVHVWIWRLQYVFMALVIATAAFTVAGLFGGGGISLAQEAGGGAGIVYQRFARYGRETVVEVRPSDGRVGIPLAYFERFKLDAVVPEPRTQRVEGNRIVFEFDAAGDLAVRFHLLPRRSGRSETVITAGTAFTITQFTWP